MKRQCFVLLGAVLLSACAGLPAGLDDFLGAPSEQEIASALREALVVGAQRASTRLGRRDGYWGDPRLRIPPPEMLDRASRYLRATGHARAVADFEEALNHAAEEAAPQAAAVFADAVRGMSLDDARGIFKGADDAATQFLRRTTQDRLSEAFRPIVVQATGRVGVTRRYKQLVAKAGPLGEFLLKDAHDLDGYVTARALDGLFLVLAEEEARIRRDPAARSTELLSRVFGRAG